MAGRPVGTTTEKTFEAFRSPATSEFRALYADVKEMEKQTFGEGGAKHNKSGKVLLSVMDFASNSLEFVYGCWMTKACATLQMGQQIVVPGSPCVFMNAKDGRMSIPGPWVGASAGASVKLAHGYQMVALLKFGPLALIRCTTTKSESGVEPLTISHVCGTADCCNPDHLLLELKQINDERTHCHNVLLTWLANGHPVKEFQRKGCCHHPSCCSVVSKELCKLVGAVPIVFSEDKIKALKAAAKASSLVWGIPAFEKMRGLANLCNLGTSKFMLDPVLNQGFSLADFASSARSSRIRGLLVGPKTSLTAWVSGKVGKLSPFKSPRPREPDQSDDEMQEDTAAVRDEVKADAGPSARRRLQMT